MGISGTGVQVQHIVWDWNGTLLDDNAAVLAAVNQVCTAFDREPVSLQEWRGMFRRPIRHSYEDLLRRELTAAEWARLDRQYHDAYNAVLHTCGLAEDGLTALRDWQQSGRSQSLLSMWFHRELCTLVAEFGLDQYFTRVDGLRQETGGGSKAEHLAEHLDAVDVDPAQVVLIGDVTDDAKAAREAGAHCILVSTGMANPADLADAGVPVAESISGALRLL